MGLNAMNEKLRTRRRAEEVGERKTCWKKMRILAGQDFAECVDRKIRKHCRRDLREQCERYVRVRRVRRGYTMFHDLGRGHGLCLCGANTTAESGRRAVPSCLGFNCEKKCQQTEAQGKRSAPIGRGSGEPSRHNGSLSRACETRSYRKAPGSDSPLLLSQHALIAKVCDLRS